MCSPQVGYVSSTDGGATWSDPQALSPGPPSLAVFPRTGTGTGRPRLRQRARAAVVVPAGKNQGNAVGLFPVGVAVNGIDESMYAPKNGLRSEVRHERSPAHDQATPLDEARARRSRCSRPRRRSARPRSDRSARTAAGPADEGARRSVRGRPRLPRKRRGALDHRGARTRPGRRALLRATRRSSRPSRSAASTTAAPRTSATRSASTAARAGSTAAAADDAGRPGRHVRRSAEPGERHRHGRTTRSTTSGS